MLNLLRIIKYVFLLTPLLMTSMFYNLYDFEEAIIIRLGSITKIEKTAGLHFKLPLIENVIIVNKKLLNTNLIEKEMICADQKKCLISAIIKYKIVDAKKFYETLLNYDNANQKVKNAGESAVRNKIGKIILNDLLSEKRIKITQDIQEQIGTTINQFGLEIYDFRINKTDLPNENREAVFNRMISERKQEVAQIKSEGEKLKQIIMSEADLKYQTLLTEGLIEVAQIKSQAIENVMSKKQELINSSDNAIIEKYTNIKSLESILSNAKSVTISTKAPLFKDLFN